MDLRLLQFSSLKWSSHLYKRQMAIFHSLLIYSRILNFLKEICYFSAFCENTLPWQKLSATPYFSLYPLEMNGDDHFAIQCITFFYYRVLWFTQAIYFWARMFFTVFDVCISFCNTFYVLQDAHRHTKKLVDINYGYKETGKKIKEQKL